MLGAYPISLASEVLSPITTSASIAGPSRAPRKVEAARWCDGLWSVTCSPPSPSWVANKVRLSFGSRKPAAVVNLVTGGSHTHIQATCFAT